MTITECKDMFAGKQCTVLGFGISNRPLCRLLLDWGAILCVRDKKSPAELGGDAEALLAAGVSFRTGEDYLSGIEADYIFRSPGIRPDHPSILSAVEKGAVLLSEMELFFELCPCPIFAVTGSDGKTTTTTLLSLLLRAAGKTVFLGGNIGAPLLPQVEKMQPSDCAVVELSSFQLMTMRRGADTAVITNLSPNHLDWHSGMEEYIESKKNILRGDCCRRVILNAENPVTAGIADDRALLTGKDRRLFSSARVLDGEKDVYERDSVIFLGSEPILATGDILLPGRHNVENYMAAIGAVGELVPAEKIREVAKSFPGVEHRIEFVREKDGVRYYNSSIDSSPTRTAAALRSFSGKKLIVICGGYDKHIPFAPLGEVLCEKASKVVLTGATREAIREAVENCESSEKPALYIEEDFDRAVRLAASLADGGDIVILSPGCASFDAFPNFMVRGDRFKELVMAL